MNVGSNEGEIIHQMPKYRRLPAGFSLERYGVSVRLADVQDSDFILSLRTDKKLSRYIHNTDNDLAKQEEWMRAYKQREQEGKEYYFIYSHKGEKYGVNRIYNIQANDVECGSWICKQGISPELPMLCPIIIREIVFDVLGYSSFHFEVRKANKFVNRFHRLVGAIVTGETENDYLYRLTSASFSENKIKLLKQLNINP